MTVLKIFVHRFLYRVNSLSALFPKIPASRPIASDIFFQLPLLDNHRDVLMYDCQNIFTKWMRFFFFFFFFYYFNNWEIAYES